RADGYHLLQTVYQFLDFADALEFQVRADGAITLAGNSPEIPVESDLIYRAARLLQQRTGTESGADIRLHKRIPIGGGLGGGSSDAATTLVALDRYWKTGLDTRELASLGLSLGADVPVFVTGRAAFAEGVGELLTVIDPPEKWYVVAHPGIGISTAAVFNDPELTRNTPAITIRDFLGGSGLNDCEAVVRKRHPEVAQLIDWLGERAPSRLTGTGACVYAACPDKASAGKILAELPVRWQGFIAKGVNRSPLLDRLALAASEAGIRSRNEAVTDA
ncbi:MAG TPA: 4-(cytidine 5'-diphospho)-2-C-methyl-D-erythritol kinase, partial [Gammaproteobacteria bacterium]|nr:4-(cytidine 5'-diphospho)-2-C-methyl-D-erythritol kinase [Gammaproteobacteria bacterium]